MAILTLACLAVSAADDRSPPRRAKPPVWTPDVLDTFFEDAREHLVGERPNPHGHAEIASSTTATTPTTTQAVQTQSEVAWSKLIDGETLAAEVKRIVAGLREPLANATKFKAGGSEQVRADFSMLAVLFGVIAEYDGEVRWQDDAPALRDALAGAAVNLESTSAEGFVEAVERMTQLDDAIRGERLALRTTSTAAKWSGLADRPLLMKRMELSLEERISPALANAKEFAKQAVDVRHEAELLAMLADVIRREEYDYWDDEGFQELSRELRTAATDLTRAAVEANYEAARQAAGRAGQACSACHDGWRG